jgi:hypothetical protein
MNGNLPEPDTIVRDDWIALTLRLRPDIHANLAEIKERTGRSLNSLINEACENSVIPPGGAAKIARERRRLQVRSDPARAALAYVLGYFGHTAQARKAWPGQGRFSVAEGDPSHLATAGALIAAEIDKTDGRGRWATSARSLSPSGR